MQQKKSEQKLNQQCEQMHQKSFLSLALCFGTLWVHQTRKSGIVDCAYGGLFRNADSSGEVTFYSQDNESQRFSVHKILLRHFFVSLLSIR